LKFISHITLIILILHSIYHSNNFSQTNIPQNNKLQSQIKLAKLFETRGDVEEAEKIYRELYTQQPQNYQFYNFLYKNLISQKKYDQGLILVKNQIEIGNNKVNLYGDLGSIYYQLGDEKNAMTIWNDAIEIEPKNEFAYRTIANYFTENRLIENAIELLIKGNKVSSDPTMFSYDIANFYSITMKYEEATREYCKILVQKPKQLNLIKNRIIQYINTNQAEEPTIRVIKEIYDDEENIIFLQLLAELYSRTDNRELALKSIIEVEEKTTRNGSAIFAFAQQSVRISDHKVAAIAFKKIIESYPESALLSEAEIGYTRSLEKELNNTISGNMNWKPYVIKKQIDTSAYINLIRAYKILETKYPDNKVGLEAQFRAGKIYLNNLNQLDIADSIFKKILDEETNIHFIEEVFISLAKIAVQNGELERAENFLLKIYASIVRTVTKAEVDFLLAKINMWKGEFSNSLNLLKKVTKDSKEENVNDALQYSLILNTFKNDSTNLFYFANADYLVEKKKFKMALQEFKTISENKELFLLKDFASLRYVELLLALNNYREASIFLEEVSNCDEDNIYKDRFLYLLGSNYYYGLKDNKKALGHLTRIFEEFPNSIYFSKAGKIISLINAGVGNSL